MRLVSDIAYGKLFGAVDASSGESRSPLVRSWRLFRRARMADVVFTNEGKQTPPGLVLLALLLWLTRQRKLVLSEFLPGTRHGAKGQVVTSAYGFLLPRVLLAAQVMTDWERDDYAARYRIPVERLHVVPFYYFDDRVVDEPAEWRASHRSGYLSTGKNACDWATLIEAAADQDWPLTIVSKRAEADAIGERAARADVMVRADVPRGEHDEMLATSALLIVALKEKSVSAGHVRLMTAATYGTPVVLSAIAGVRGYEPLAASLVAPEDPAALRASVNALMSDPAALEARMSEVRTFARQRPYSRYVAEVGEMLEKAAAEAAATRG